MGTIVPWLWLHFCVAAVGTWLARRYAIARQLVDEPGERRSHAVATPRGGGIAIVAALLLAALWLAARSPAQAAPLSSFAVGLLLVAGIGWWDDHRPLSPWMRLFVHFIAAVQFAAVLLWHTGSWPTALVALIGILVLVNVWNFMDGIDGLAASQAAISALTFAFWLPPPWSWLAAALFAGACGFLPFNFPRARIFLGDVGSGALGFALGALLAMSTESLQKSMLMLLPMAAFLVDASFTLSSRMLTGERWWTPHVSHVYQRAARRFGHTRVTNAYLALSGVTLLLIWFVCNVEARAVPWVAAGWYAWALALWGWARRQLK